MVYGRSRRRILASGPLDRPPLALKAKVEEIHLGAGQPRSQHQSVAQGPWMSERSFRGSEDRLRDEVLELRQEVRVLRTRLERQEDDISALVRAVEKLNLREEREKETQSEASCNSTLWECVSSAKESKRGYEAGAQASVPQEDRGGSGISWEFRQEVARGVGQFIRRALNGDHRKNSGRERLKLQSTCYLIAKDFEGKVYDRPVLIETRFNRVVALCKRGTSWGDSVFVGLPTVEEARIAANEAGLAVAGPAQPFA